MLGRIAALLGKEPHLFLRHFNRAARALDIAPPLNTTTGQPVYKSPGEKDKGQGEQKWCRHANHHVHLVGSVWNWYVHHRQRGALPLKPEWLQALATQFPAMVAAAAAYDGLDDRSSLAERKEKGHRSGGGGGGGSGGGQGRRGASRAANVDLAAALVPWLLSELEACVVEIRREKKSRLRAGDDLPFRALAAVISVDPAVDNPRAALQHAMSDQRKQFTPKGLQLGQLYRWPVNSTSFLFDAVLPPVIAPPFMLMLFFVSICLGIVSALYFLSVF
jgi:hypothetical protein